jgi:hypothetical protein
MAVVSPVAYLLVDLPGILVIDDRRSVIVVEYGVKAALVGGHVAVVNDLAFIVKAVEQLEYVIINHSFPRVSEDASRRILV